MSKKIENETKVISGQFHAWILNGTQRTYADIHLPYREAREFIQPVRYDALRGRGEQRQMAESHARKLKGEMWGGNYTPTQMKANLRKDHKANLVLDQETRQFTLTINSDNPLAQTDGSHRYGAIEKLLAELQERAAKLDGKPKEAILAKIEETLNLEIGIRVYFDGDPQNDFINLQASRVVDRSHLLSMRIQKGLAGDESMKMAFAIAKIVTKSDASPFKSVVRFDSKATSGSMVKQLPISTILAKAASDLSTSLVGLAKVGLANGKDVQFLANCVIGSYLAIKQRAEGLFAEDKVLTPVRNGGTKGSATMLIGVAICMAQLLILNEREEATEEELDLIVEAAQATLDEEIDGSLDTTRKRALMGEFAQAVFALKDDLHGGIPTSLLKATSCSAWATESLPKASKRPRKNRDEEPVTEEALSEVIGQPVEWNEAVFVG